MKEYPKIVITKDMVNSARELIDEVKVERTIASQIDTLTGILGEFVFAEYFYGDWKLNRIGENKGEINFEDIEIKTSAFPFNEKLHLLVREDYKQKRKPPFYVQVIIDVSSRHADDIPPRTNAYICGFATCDEVENASKKDFGSKFGGKGGYKCYHIQITELHSMSEFKGAYNSYKNHSK